MKSPYGVIVYLSRESWVDAGIAGHIDNLVDEFDVVECAFVLTKLGCPQQAIALCDSVRALWDIGGIGFRFVADHVEQGLPLCDPGCYLLRVSIDEFAQRFKKGPGETWCFSAPQWDEQSQTPDTLLKLARADYLSYAIRYGPTSCLTLDAWDTYQRVRDAQRIITRPPQ
jgi:hypothetical protein